MEFCFEEKGMRCHLPVLVLVFLIAGCTSNMQILPSKVIETKEPIEAAETEWEEIGRQYEWAMSPVLINGKLVYSAKNGDVWYIVYDGKEIETNYDEIGPLLDVGGELVHSAKKNDRWFIVYPDREIETSYREVKNLVSVGGKLAYEAIKDSRDGAKRIVVYDGQEKGGGFNMAISPADVDGKLAYIARNSNGKFIVYDGRNIWVDLDHADHLVGVGDKPAYMGLKYNEKGDIYYIVFDGEEIETTYELITQLAEVDGKLAFAAKKDDRTWVAVHDWEEGPEYTKISVITDVKGKLTYQADDTEPFGIHDGDFIVYEDKEIGKEYASAWFPSEIDGKLAYWAQKSGKFFIVMGDPDTAPIYTPPPPPPPPTTTPPPPPPANYKVHAIGPDDAKVTVIEYSDYVQSMDKAAQGYNEETLSRLKSKDPTYEPVVPKLIEMAKEGKIKFVFKNFPLGNTRPAEAAECAGAQGKFWEYQEKLFDDNWTWAYERYAEELGLDVESFNGCLSSREYEGVVSADKQEGIQNRVRGVPAFIINGKVIHGAHSFSVFEEKINAALEE
jgi:protein-disulfide isomerase